MPRKPAHHVVRIHDGRWADKREGNERASSLHDTQAEAAEAAREAAVRQGTEVYIHGRDGRIREANSYGNDPFPPAG